MQVNNRVRALLLDAAGRLLLIKRVKPNHEPYWVAPGGGVELDDESFESALRREIREELGGKIEIIKMVMVTEEFNDHNVLVRHHVYLTRLIAYDLSLRHGPEFDDPTRGDFIPEHIELSQEQLAKLNMRSEDLKTFLIMHHDSLDELPDLREPLLNAG
jgi:ADP-ribose pyrophosphatase YjhB (NUDIX family)